MHLQRCLRVKGDGLRFVYATETIASTEDGRRDVAVHVLSLPFAKLVWEVDTGEVLHIGVNADHRRQGVATALWNEAQRYGAIRHSAYRTDDGDAFARAVGGVLPRRIRV